MNKKIRAIGAVILVVIWAVLTGFAWFAPSKEISEAERRPLAQMPQITAGDLVNGKFIKAFESYTLDQFPLRDSFRTLKSLFHYYVLNQKDNNGIYLTQGHAAKLEPALSQSSVDHAMERFNWIYETYLKDSGSAVFTTVIPDKGFYIGEENGYPVMDYDALFAAVQQKMPWAEYVDITDCLTADNYYRTDTHWRQETILPVAQKLRDAMGLSQLQAEDFIQRVLERPFYGVYYGQAALPMKAEELFVLESEMLSQCSVYDHETGKTAAVYDMTKLESKDLYDVFLSGARALLTIENPNATTDKELIVFRDSFGSSLAPLLVQDYKTVTLVDIRYLGSQMLSQHLEFNGQDVLFAYSALVLNSSATLK